MHLVTLWCDQVVQYEVVLASGKITLASKDEHEDLFRALKGVANNFGIVTRFETNAFEAPQLWSGVATYTKDAGDALLDAMVAFTNNVEKDMESSSIIFWTYQPALNYTLIIAYENTAGVVRGPSFEKYLAVPGNISSTVRLTNMSDLTEELEQPSEYRYVASRIPMMNNANTVCPSDIWFTLTFRNDKKVLDYAVKTPGQLVLDIQSHISEDADLITQCMFQPLPTIFAEHSTEQGGNMLGLDRETDNALLWLATLVVRSANEESCGRTVMAAWVRDIGTEMSANMVPRPMQRLTLSPQLRRRDARSAVELRRG